MSRLISRREIPARFAVPSTLLTSARQARCRSATATGFACRTRSVRTWRRSTPKRRPMPITIARWRMPGAATDSLPRSFSWRADKLLKQRGHFNTVLFWRNLRTARANRSK